MYDPKKLLADIKRQEQQKDSIIPEPCWGSDKSGFGQGSGKKTDNDGDALGTTSAVRPTNGNTGDSVH